MFSSYDYLALVGLLVLLCLVGFPGLLGLGWPPRLACKVCLAGLLDLLGLVAILDVLLGISGRLVEPAWLGTSALSRWYLR